MNGNGTRDGRERGAGIREAEGVRGEVRWREVVE